MQMVEPKTKYSIEIENLKTLMANLGTQIAMAHPEYRDLHGQLKILVRLHQEELARHIEPPFNPPPAENKTEVDK